MKRLQMLWAVPLLASGLVLAAAASPIRYSVIATDANTGVTVTGQFEMNGGSPVSWSFDLSQAAGTYSDFGSGHDPFGGNWQQFQPVDAHGSYILNGSDSVNNDYSGRVAFTSYTGDFTPDPANPNTSTWLGFYYAGALPESGGSVAINTNISTLDQCTSCNGTYNFTDYFTSGKITQLTPEPPAWTLAGAGLLLLAGLAYWSERRRAIA